MLEAAASPDKTSFQYIIVGSGAGGGPLAARLARAGRRVLLLEAGEKPAVMGTGASSKIPNPPEVQQVPGYHAAATEQPDISWGFSVRHYSDTEQQKKDSKYFADKDPSENQGNGKGGIFYPRASALGGCTAHYAMIIIAPNDRDWDAIADRTGDDSWRAEWMQRYFTRIEKCLYYKVYRDFFHRLLGFIYSAALRVGEWINPRGFRDPGSHGDRGWQPTSFIDPNLVAKISERDSSFRNVLVNAVGSVLGEKGLFAALKRLVQLHLVASLDPNDRNNRRTKREELAFIPIGTDGVSRIGVRELLLGTCAAHPKNLVIVTGVHVTRLLFSKDKVNGEDKDKESTPRARGVAVEKGAHLYQASPLYRQNSPSEKRNYFATEEVILCGGSFNTPQLLMLSGIGDKNHLATLNITNLQGIDGKPVCPAIHLPGVGLNLQDRYEVSVISELKQSFGTLDKVTFDPADKADPAWMEWLESRTGLYTTNGGTIAVLKRSNVDEEKPEPDLFIFGAPVSFRGYYWGWSKDLLHKKPAQPDAQRNLWSWIILKAYTHNNGGSVRLRSDSPFETPEICFNSFGPDGSDEDLNALVDAVKFVRQVNDHGKSQFAEEIQPAERGNNDADLKGWIKDEAWGHHACGTCRIGSDPWQSDVSKLCDREAVLDSKFKVHGVRGLRVVDASIFPTIPGYFIVTPVFMISEKAGDTILAETDDYPEPLKGLENAAVKSRRKIAHPDPSDPEKSAVSAVRDRPGCEAATDPELPVNQVGLALSGGGIRSATFCLGVLQALARKNRFRDIDFLSSVSGGSYIGGFLGRLFTRVVPSVADKVKHVQDKVANLDSPEIDWLRSTANYIAGGGFRDIRRDLAIFWRNLFAVHLVIAALLVASFGVLKWVGDHWLHASFLSVPSSLPFPLSPWWLLAIGVVILAVLPGSLGFWLAPRPGITSPHPLYSLLAWIVLLAGAVIVLALPGGLLWGVGLIAILILSYLWQEVARWYVPKHTNPGQHSVIIRSELTVALGEVIFVFAGVLVWVVLDTIARSVAKNGLTNAVMAILLLLGPVLPFLKMLADWLSKAYDAKKNSAGGISLNLTASIIAFPLAAFLLLVVDVLAQNVFGLGAGPGFLMVVILTVFSLLIGRALNFLNLSSLHAPYAARLTRTFLGASNSERLFGTGTTAPTSVLISHPADDIPFARYHPEENGGPLHLINVCVNETVDFGVERDVRDRKGLSMALGPFGVSVSRRFHGIWTKATPGAKEKSAVQAIPAGYSPDSFHVLARTDGKPALVEPLRLGQWIGISGAAIGTGEGYFTSLPMSLIFGLANIRLGYWWNSGISAGDRPGYYPKSLWQRIKTVPALLFRTQSMILSEWRSYFRGPSERFWYLSDGGHFEVTGMYELVRRRLPFIIVLDAGEDPDYHYNDLARCTRLIRLDFGAELEWLDPTQARAAGKAGWAAFGDPPPWVTGWLDPAMIGCPEKIGRSGPYHSALGKIGYLDGKTADSWVFLIKPSLTGDEFLDVLQYSSQNALFPNSPTTNQFYGDQELECYRGLGDHIGTKVFQSHQQGSSSLPSNQHPAASAPNVGSKG
jgi:choline dehydrogenase-like flavoprotein